MEPPPLAGAAFDKLFAKSATAHIIHKNNNFDAMFDVVVAVVVVVVFYKFSLLKQ